MEYTFESSSLIQRLGLISGNREVYASFRRKDQFGP